MKQNNKLMLSIFISLITLSTYSQKIKIVNSGTKTSLRGLSIVDENIIWASGSNGMIAKSVDGGANWKWIQVPNFEKKDFRDIEAFDSNTAIIMSIAEPAYILKTIDGGKNFITVFYDSTKGMFLDAMSFYDAKNGVVIGDPINGKTFIATTINGGNSWIKNDNAISIDSNEAFFASSGSNISLVWNKKNNSFENYFVSGGVNSNFYIDNKKIEIPIIKGKQSTGANSIAINKNKNAIIVGGDFNNDSLRENNCVLINLKSFEISQPEINPTGYRSSVVFLNNKIAIACGLNGIDISYNKGKTWKKISNEGFHVVKKSKYGNSIFLAGSKGRIAQLIF